LIAAPAEPQQQGGKKKDFPALETVQLSAASTARPRIVAVTCGL
jgi:hypothetical protein